MIRIQRYESANGGTGRSALGPDRGARSAPARKAPSRIVRAVERFIARRPGVCLGAALSVGIVLGWWVKRL